MSEHHHSLKRETFHETNPLLYQVLTKPTLGKHRPQRQREETGERGKGRREMGGGGTPEFVESKREKNVKFWQEISSEPREARALCHNDGNFDTALILNISVTKD